MTRLFVAIGLLSGLAATQAFGQTYESKAEIPFAFHVGNASLPAGTYYIKQMNNVAYVRSETGSPAYFALTSNLGEAKSSQGVLRFRGYGDERFLSEIWAGGAAQGRVLLMGKNERTIARNYVPGQKKDETVALNRPPK